MVRKISMNFVKNIVNARQRFVKGKMNAVRSHSTFVREPREDSLSEKEKNRNGGSFSVILVKNQLL